MDIKLWFDDIRPAPDSSWVWAKNVPEAQAIFAGPDEVVEAALDHDIWDPESGGVLSLQGIDLAHWMAANHFVPDRIVIHSWNPPGAKRMAEVLHDARPDADIVVRPFVPMGGEQGHGYGCGVWKLLGAGPCTCGQALAAAR